MASAIRSKISQVAHGSSNHVDAESKHEAEKYRLRVTAGPSYDQASHKTVLVNTDTPTVISNEYLTAKIKVRIRGYRGLPTSSPSSSPYFDDPIHEKDQYSIAFSFVPKIDIPSVHTVWGNDFDHPVRDRLPPGFNTAFKIVKEFIDPGLQCDAYADEPWLLGPSLSCWFAFKVGDTVGERADFPAPSDEDVMKDGADGSGAAIRQKHGIPDNNEKRRKYFLTAKNREAFIFEKGRCYQADFYNPYIDFGNFALKLPGFSLNVVKYIDQKSHCLRYVFKNRESGEVFFNVNFHLLWGDKLKEQLAKEQQQRDGVDRQADCRDGVVDGDSKKIGDDRGERRDNKGQAQASAQGQDTQAQLPEKTVHTANSSPEAIAAHVQKVSTVDDEHVDEIRQALEDTSTSDKQRSEPFMFKDSF